MAETSAHFDLFVGVTVVPLWKKPPANAQEVRERADLTEEFLKASNRLGDLLKKAFLSKVSS
jgi:hypothetical protein